MFSLSQLNFRIMIKPSIYLFFENWLVSPPLNNRTLRMLHIELELSALRPFIQFPPLRSHSPTETLQQQKFVDMWLLVKASRTPSK